MMRGRTTAHSFELQRMKRARASMPCALRAGDGQARAAPMSRAVLEVQHS